MDTTPLVKEHYRLFVDGLVEQLHALHDVVPTWRPVAEVKIGSRLDAVRRRLCEVSSDLYDDFGAEFSLLDQTQRDLYASLAVRTATSVESVFTSICRQYKLPLASARPDWGQKRTAVEKHLGVKCGDLPGFAAATKARGMANSYKHQGGHANEECAKLLGIKEGDVIEYEKHDWQAIIGGVSDFLHALTHRV